jgi:hypothetical protein
MSLPLPFTSDFVFVFAYFGLTMQRKPMCAIEVSTIWAWRAAGR